MTRAWLGLVHETPSSNAVRKHECQCLCCTEESAHQGHAWQDRLLEI